MNETVTSTADRYPNQPAAPQRVATVLFVAATLLFVAFLGCQRSYDGSSRNGIVDRRGNFVAVDADLGFYDDIGLESEVGFGLPFSGGLAPARSATTRKWGFLNKAGKWAIEPQFGLAGRFSEGLAMVEIDGKVGFIDPSGRLAIKPSFDQVAFDDAEFVYFSSGLCPVKSNDKWGYVDKAGRMAIAPKFYYPSPFREGMAAVITHLGRPWSQWGYINAQGSFAIKPQYKCAFPFSEGLASVLGNDKWGYINKTGTYAIGPSFSFAGPFRNGLAEVFAGDKASIINQSGVIVIKDLELVGGKTFALDAVCAIGEPDRRMLVVRSFVDDRAPLSSAGKWGYIDHMGRVLIEPAFEEARQFSEGLAAVKMGGKWGFINPAGASIIQPTFNGAGDFHDGVSFVAK